ncbi:MAG: beta-Ala-His dipeptidase [Bacteroidales bacterium]|nr:beta-Ala-His dipeptidase [Bacteroidales bacterium]
MNARIWEEFYALCQVPHPSGHLSAMRSYILDKVKKAGLIALVDEVGNILVQVPATAGWQEKAQRQGRDPQSVTTLQAHIDMVPQANHDVSFNFQTDPLQVHEVDGLVMAQGTTLGADNGIGVAAMLALLPSDASAPETVVHGPLELLFTVDEEVGMAGVRGMQPGWLTGTQLINLDTEEEGQLMVGCAGAVDVTASFRYKLVHGAPDGDQAVKLTLGGLKGGHSGMDIHLGRGNACKLMTRFLKHAVVCFEARLASFQGGGVRNAIPREATAILTVPAEVVEDLQAEVAYYEELFRYELRGVDEGITFRATLVDTPDYLLPEEVQDDILNSLEAAPDGLFRFSPDLPNVVETSSNLAAVIMKEEGESGHCSVILMVRSMNEEMKRALSSRIQSCFILGGARVDFSAAYSGWEQSPSSPLPQRIVAAYRSLFATDMKVNSVHCGLECGVLHDLYPDLPIVSFGPTIHHPHSPEESVEVASVDKFWQLLQEVI